MKIAIVSDIHANKLAFDNVLEDIKQFNPDKIFCLGDLILAGYNPNYVCQKIIELKENMGEDFVIIQGNTDAMVANANPQLIEKVKEAFACMGYSLEDDIKITKKEYIDYVAKLPQSKSLVINNLRIDLVHGSCRKQDENIYPDLDSSAVEEMVESSNADLILCGHTHLPCGYTLDSGKTVVNVGSVGRSMTADRQPVYLQLTIDKNSKFFVEHRIVPYDNKQVSSLILTRNFPHCEDLAKMYLP